MSSRSCIERIAIITLVVAIVGTFATLMLVPEFRKVMSPIKKLILSLPKKVSEKSSGLQRSLTLPVEFPDDSNILIFNACSDGIAHERLAEILKESCTVCQIDASYDWLNRWEMKWTRIYFLKKEFRIVAQEFINHFPGEQEVIDYNDQSDVYFTDCPWGHSRMVNINLNRDLVIFIGNDYEQVLSSLYSNR